MNNLKTFAAALLFALAVLFGAVRIGPLPAMGAFLDPANGVWATVRSAELPDASRASIPGLGDNVRVMYDDRGVPHIYGDSYRDVISALGYVVARDRLFQLDLQTRSTAGTLSEILGNVALRLDQQARRLDLAGAAERNFADLAVGGREREMLAAFAEGANAWIENLHPRDYPFEYKLVGAGPSPWKPVHALYLMKRMGWNLAYDNLERRKLAAAAYVGWEAAHALFPIHAPIQEPIQANGASGPRFDFPALPPPGAPDPDAAQQLAFGNAFGFVAPAHAGTEDVVGSNNWAVSPSRTANGYALLAGDPHLGMSLPSVWYEVHTVVRDSLDVYGVTLPGAPGIIIGFNRNVAWSFTNTGADVKDLYVEEVDDLDVPTRYKLDGEWRELRVRVEEYHGRGGAVLAVDTLYLTHRGPMTRNGDEWWSLRWTVLEGEGEQAAFLNIMSAGTVDEWLAAMTTSQAPAQNGIVADRNGSIAIRSHGRYPIRPGVGRGDLVQDGTSSANDWTGAWPVSRYPYSIDPGQGYLASANQQPIDPRAESAYLGAAWPSPWRAIRINQLLRENDSLTPDDLRVFQTDPGSARADMFAPALVAAGRRHLADSADGALEAAVVRLESWSRTYEPDNTGAVLFERAMQHLAYLTWDELDSDDDQRPFVRPGSGMLAMLLRDSASTWWDNGETPDVVESMDWDLVGALKYASARLQDELGDDPKGWQWREHRRANILHLLRINELSAVGVEVQGGTSTLSPSSGSGQHGASWRMVVEMGPDIRAWATYPGGQSGNPVSRFYRDRIGMWSRGELAEVLFPPTEADFPDQRIVSRLDLGRNQT